MSRIIDSLNDYFEIVPANTTQLLNEVYRIRYQVLCVEEQIPDFEAEKYPDGYETDVYDSRAAQSLLRHRPTGQYVGTVRLILGDPAEPARPFPIEAYAGKHFDSALVRPSEMPRRATAEISRLVLRRDFRTRNDATMYPRPNLDSSEKLPPYCRNATLPFLSLLVAIMRMTVEHGITHWYAGMEPALHRRLVKLGFKLTAIGPVVEYHGLRRPYLGVVDELMSSIYFEKREIWELISDEGTLWPAPKAQLATKVLSRSY